MTTVLPSWCDYCTHNGGDGTCSAFPGGIPFEVATEGHSTPLPGQMTDDVFTLDGRKRRVFEEIRLYLP